MTNLQCWDCMVHLQVANVRCGRHRSPQEQVELDALHSKWLREGAPGMPLPIRKDKG